MKKRRLCKNCFSQTQAGQCPVCGYIKSRNDRDLHVLSRGTKIAGKYIIGGSIGRGGFGITYLAYDTKNEKTVAIKEYFPSMLVRRGKRLRVVANSEKSAEQFNIGAEKFLDEADLVRRFNGNPNIVSIYECFYENNTAYYAMEYLDGITLQKYVENYGVLNSEQALYIAEKITMALVVLHSGEVLHRDISPDNVMICREGSVKLIDFGSARQFLEEGMFGYTVTMKTGFSPMEQYSQKTGSDIRADIYSLGTLLHYALTGRVPKNPYQRMEDDSLFSENSENADGGLWSVILKAAAIMPSERYKSAEEIRTALSQLDITAAPIPVPADYNSLKAKNTGLPPQQNHFANIGRYAAVSAVTAAICAAVTIPLILRKPPSESSSASSPALDSSSFAQSTTDSSSSQPTPDSFPSAQSTTDSSSASQPTADSLAEEQKNSERIELVLDSEYQGNFNIGGRIPSSYLAELGGDVKVTLFVESWEGMPADDIQGVIPVNGDDKSMLEYLTSEDELWADENGWIDIHKGSSELSFVLSREGIESLGEGDFAFETYNIIINSAVLTPSEKQSELRIFDNRWRNVPYYCVSDSEEGKTVTVTFEEYDIASEIYTTQSIPKSAFYEFDGDVKVTLEMEKLEGITDNWHLVYVHNSGLCCNVFSDDFLVPELRDENGNTIIRRNSSYALIADISCSEYIIIIPKEIKDKMSGGIIFQSMNAVVKSARLENYYGGYNSFVYGG